MPAVHGAAAHKFRSLCRAWQLLRIAQNNVDAAAAYSNSLRLKPAQPDILARLGELMLQSGDAAEALSIAAGRSKSIQATKRRGPLSAASWRRPGALDTAEALLEAQAKSPAELAQNLDQLGAFLRAERRHEEAVSIYRKVVSLEPDRADWKFNLALALEAFSHRGRRETQKSWVRSLFGRHRKYRSGRALQRCQHGRCLGARPISETIACCRASHDAARRRAVRLDAEYGFDHSAGPRCHGYEPLLGRARALPQLYQSPVSAVARNPKASNSPSTTSANATARAWK